MRQQPTCWHKGCQFNKCSPGDTGAAKKRWTCTTTASATELGGLLGIHARAGIALPCAVPPPTPSPPKPTKEGERGEGEGEGTAQANALSAQGVLRELHCPLRCPSCNLHRNSEAAYICTKCQSMYHVRCMGHHAGVPSREVHYTTT